MQHHSRLVWILLSIVLPFPTVIALSRMEKRGIAA
jgi:hypothetical protein